MGRPNQGGHVRKLGGKTSYRLIRVMVNGKSKQVLEHRYMLEQHLGRKLKRSEIVHHRDEDGLHNEISNFELMNQSDHQKHHLMTGPKKWPLDEAMGLYKQGWTLAALGKKYGVSWTTIRKCFKNRGIDTTNKRWGTNKWNVNLAKKMLDHGKNLSEIADISGVSKPAVRMTFIKRGWWPLKK